MQLAVAVKMKNTSDVKFGLKIIGVDNNSQLNPRLKMSGRIIS
jgi:hypothetical protein